MMTIICLFRKKKKEEDFNYWKLACHRESETLKLLSDYLRVVIRIERKFQFSTRKVNKANDLNPQAQSDLARKRSLAGEKSLIEIFQD